MPLTITCTRCGASATGTVAAVAAWDKTHDQHCPAQPETAPPSPKEPEMAAKTKTANATSVSKALTDAGLTKSVRSTTRIRGYHSSSWGFVAANETDTDPATYAKVRTGAVTVRWVSGNFATLPGDVEAGAAKLVEATEILTAKGCAVRACRAHRHPSRLTP